MSSIDRRSFLRAAAAAGLIPLPPALTALTDPAGPAVGALPDLGAPLLPPSPADYPLESLDLDRVDITDTFWRARMKVNRDVSLMYCFEKFDEGSGSGTCKLIDGAAFMLQKEPDAELQAYVNGRIDGLLGEFDRRIRTPEQSVELPNHFFEAAVHYPKATGEREILEGAVERADRIDAVYGPGKMSYITPHEGMEMGLVELYRGTGDERYWKLAKFLVDQRGKTDYPREGRAARYREYAQDHAPVVEQYRALGHCVRATFLYIALTDIAALTGNVAYLRALRRIWEDQTLHKTFLTGGIGSVRFHEQYGEPYELPNLSCWCETCAAYGNMVWNHRMFLLERDARYVDVMERALYNALLVGVSLEGDRFFYQNALKSFGDYRRFEWINVPCCPPNVVRTVASVGSYMYATDSSSGAIYVNLFVDSDARLDSAGRTVRLRQETRHPWDGAVRLRVDPKGEASFPLYVRIPGWARGEVLPGDLYRFADRDRSRPTLRVNGRTVSLDLVNGYARLERRWREGDVIELDLPMPVRRVVAHEKVQDDRGRVALQRGPLVYCAEWPDNDGHALNLVIPDEASFDTEFRRDLLNGVQVVKGAVEAIQEDSRGVAASTASREMVAIPYFAWANRGQGEMAVWLARDPARAWLPPSLPSPIARVDSSGGVEKVWTGYNDVHDNIASIHDGREPLNSADASYRFFRMRPPAGEQAWVVYELEAPTRLTRSRVYFLDDKRFCTLPDWWRVLFRDGDEWKPVEARNPYGVALDAWSEVEFYPVTTMALKLEVEPSTVRYRGGATGPPAAMPIEEDVDWREFGIIEWQIE